jgi:hypothetical protein
MAGLKLCPSSRSRAPEHRLDCSREPRNLRHQETATLELSANTRGQSLTPIRSVDRGSGGRTTESYNLGLTENPGGFALAGAPTGAIGSRSRRNSRIPLIRSKFLPPAPPPGAVPRPRLLEKLASGRGRALTLVCAPAGYGKTTLLSQWIAEAVTADAARVTLDAGDADPARFWRYLLSELDDIIRQIRTIAFSVIPDGAAWLRAPVNAAILGSSPGASCGSFASFSSAGTTSATAGRHSGISSSSPGVPPARDQCLWPAR